jgi:UDP-N-acetylglucosamine--N-acetylmuramyl-(pentapeptide) pyrophosphoryl-undecaprenol N-acetylglucosamine transferase
MSKADLIVSRSGAHICAEILALNKPALLIPIPWVSHNEQYLNALEVKNSGLGEILEEKALTSQTLILKISDMLKNINKYSVNKTYDSLQNNNAAQLIVSEILKCLK